MNTLVLIFIQNFVTLVYKLPTQFGAHCSRDIDGQRIQQSDWMRTNLGQ